MTCTPRKCQTIYFDTDSIFLSVTHLRRSWLLSSVDPQWLEYFVSRCVLYLDWPSIVPALTDTDQKLWVVRDNFGKLCQETQARFCRILTEKVYVLINSVGAGPVQLKSRMFPQFLADELFTKWSLFDIDNRPTVRPDPDPHTFVTYNTLRSAFKSPGLGVSEYRLRRLAFAFMSLKMVQEHWNQFRPPF